MSIWNSIVGTKFNNPRNTIYNGMVLYPTPGELTYSWNFGFLAGIMLASQIITGFFLVIWYIPAIDLAFTSVNFIVNEVKYGWLTKSLHANGASFFFIVVYLHILRNIYYSSYVEPRQNVWYSGVIIFILLILTAFLGYVLPWGQMSYWAATVISSLISTIPYFGDPLLIFLWGGLTIGQPTLTRIFGLHFLLPFILVFLTFVHLLLLHRVGSGTPLGILGGSTDKVSFHPYYTLKDTLSCVVMGVLYFVIVTYLPDYLGHPDNYILANPGVTPLHIVPEWYFLPFYGILRSVPSKAGGVILLAAALGCLLVLPKLGAHNVIRNGNYRPAFTVAYMMLMSTFGLLGWSGAQPIEYPYLTICQLTTICYFIFFLVLVPLTNVVDMNRVWSYVTTEGGERGRCLAKEVG